MAIMHDDVVKSRVPPSGSCRHGRDRNNEGRGWLVVLTSCLEGVSSEVIGFFLVRCFIVVLTEVLCAHLPSKAWLLKGRGVPRIRRGTVGVCYHSVSHRANERAHQASTVQEYAGLRVDSGGFGVSACNS